MAVSGKPVATQLATLEVIVVHTNTRETLCALKTAGALAAGLSARIRLLVLETVPYPLPLDRPSVATQFTERRFRTIAGESAVETRVEIHLVRDKQQTLAQLLEPHSVVVTGARCRWWHNPFRALARAGHQVIHAR